MRINESRCKVAAYSSKLDVSTRKLRIRSIRSAWLSITSNVNKIIQLGTVLFGYSCDKQIVQAGYLDDCLMGWIDDNQPEIIKPLLERLLAHARVQSPIEQWPATIKASGLIAQIALVGTLIAGLQRQRFAGHNHAEGHNFL